MDKLISVIITTFNPDLERLNQTLAALKNQTLSADQWELIIVDNNSSPSLSILIDWHPQYTCVVEQLQGLTYGRLKGFNLAVAELIVMVDDDNVLHPDYLKRAKDIMEQQPELGAIGGKSIPIFESQPKDWIKAFYHNLALRDLGNTVILNSWDHTYPATAPIGAGMIVRKSALKNYIDKVNKAGTVIADRSGKMLGSSGDNDIVLEILKAGWQTGYFPELILHHLIPDSRTTTSYLARLINQSNKSWMTVLKRHHINPWPEISVWSLPLRKIKAFITYSAWSNKVNYIKWRGACGSFDGLATKDVL
ncbi:glycosyltransferase [Pedobacter duraquae]|uniref:GT2 family glycosyltransferase n=1 Tax=Pedobacter duraquae TaxID=425511 RepID=A0A4R6ILW2_9SPHI|nr:glycosyltransferase [Pedobacter duraquae]TDO23149.1 GT2 family glycosyltransferase [Pedobacter duraquae]